MDDNNNYSRIKRNQELYEQEERESKKKVWKRILLIVLSLLLVYGGYTLYNFVKSVNTGFSEVENTTKVDEDFRSFSILLMGIDENESRKAEGQTRENSRTDSLIYLAVNKDKQRMDMVSIPRDSLTLMRNAEDKNDKNAYFFDKITHARAYGGEAGTIEAVSNLLNAPINFYAVINFAAFEDVINSLGGVELYVPFDMVEQNANGEMGTVSLKQGWHVLNGEEALAFSRSRYYDSDIERGQRQLQVIHAVIDKAKSLNALTKVNDLISIVGTNVTHNMSVSKITSAASMFITGDMEIVSHRIGGYDAMMNGVYYYYPKPSHLLYVSSVLNSTLGKELPQTMDILNIYYQGYIQPVVPGYSKTTIGSPNGKFAPVNYVALTVDDFLENLPDKLTLADLVNDPTVSDENKPVETTEQGQNTKS